MATTTSSGSTIPDWTPNLIASGFKFSGGAQVVVRDIDGDGRLDVMTGKYPIDDNEQRETVWYGNTPTGWVEHLVSTTSFCHDLAFADFDGDGHEDAVCADQFLYQVAWLHRPANPMDPWPSTVIDAGPRPMGAAVADIDRDGRPDVVVGMAWYRLSGGTWSKHPYTTLQDTSDPRFDDYARVSVLDLNGDGRLDIFATLFTESRQGQVYAFLAPPDPTTTWTAVPIDPGPLFGVHTQAVGQFDGTSRPQIVVGETTIGGFDFGIDPDPHIYLYRLLGDASDPAAWERTIVDNTGTHEGQAIDFNGDGLPDLAGDQENTELLTPPRDGRVSWWENVTVRRHGRHAAAARPAARPRYVPHRPGGPRHQLGRLHGYPSSRVGRNGPGECATAAHAIHALRRAGGRDGVGLYAHRAGRRRAGAAARPRLARDAAWVDGDGRHVEPLRWHRSLDHAGRRRRPGVGDRLRAAGGVRVIRVPGSDARSARTPSRRAAGTSISSSGRTPRRRAHRTSGRS